MRFLSLFSKTGWMLSASTERKLTVPPFLTLLLNPFISN